MDPKNKKSTKSLKNIRLEIRLTKEQSDLIEECSQKMNTTKTGVLIEGVKLIKKELDKNK